MAQRDKAEASVLFAEAQLSAAELDYSYTLVRSPITGQVSRRLVDIGNLVGESEATVLTDMTSYDPMYAYFSINERDLLRVMRPTAVSAAQELKAAGIRNATANLDAWHAPLR